MVIGFCGAAGTGKTTLVEELFKLPEFQHYKRYTNVQRTLHNYLGSKFPHSSKTNNISQISITSNFILQLLIEKDLICDRSLIDAFMYSILAKDVTISEELEDIFSKGLELYDIIFYTPLEFKIEEDGFRDSNMEYIEQTDYKIQEYINKYQDKVKIIKVTGTVEERMNKILKELDEYRNIK